ncbi:MAG: aldo/keto reductase [Chloroflexi bacterium]|nr:aldo/keto reductase [Chloroflexota bacterium]
MEYRDLGNTGIKVSEIGFGCGGNAGLMVKGTPDQQRDAIKRALDLGINYFDEAPDYGDGLSETNLGRVLKELGVRPYITSKVEVRAENLEDIAGHIIRSLDGSLDRMGVDHVDVLQLHNGPVLDTPVLTGRSYTHLSLEDYLRPGGALEGLQNAKDSGKARSIGFITRGNDFDAAKQIIDTGAFSVINASVNLLNPSAGWKPAEMHVEHDYSGLLGYAASQGVGACIYSPLAGGFLNDTAITDGRFHPTAGNRRSAEVMEVGFGQAQAFRFLSKNLCPDTQTEDHGLAEAAVRFVLFLDGVTSVLGGFSDADQVAEVASFSGKGPLSKGNMEKIEAIWRSNFAS